MGTRHEFGFDQPPIFQATGRNAGDQTGHGVRKDVVAWQAVQIERLVNLVQFKVSANAGDLYWPVTTRIDAGGFVVVPEDSGHGVFLNSRPCKSRRSAPSKTSPDLGLRQTLARDRS